MNKLFSRRRTNSTGAARVDAGYAPVVGGALRANCGRLDHHRASAGDRDAWCDRNCHGGAVNHKYATTRGVVAIGRRRAGIAAEVCHRTAYVRLEPRLTIVRDATGEKQCRHDSEKPTHVQPHVGERAWL